MRKVLVYSVLLFVGLGLSQALPSLLGGLHDAAAFLIRVLTMTGLAFIMIHVGFEFHIDKSRLGRYGWDYFVAFTAATFPWVLVSGYFVFVMLPEGAWGSFDAWKETLLAGRFAAPTSAGVLFSMLAAAGLGATWLFRKARILAIFDDLDTVLLMIPLKMLMVGVAWQLGAVVLLMGALLVVAYVLLHRVRMPVTWGWVLGYSAVIVGVSELLYAGSTVIDPSVPIHIEVLLPAFVIGSIARPREVARGTDAAAAEAALHAVLERPRERRAASVVSAAFMVLVGLSLPAIFGGLDAQHPAPAPAELHAAAPGAAVDDEAGRAAEASAAGAGTITAAQPALGWGAIVLHVLLITLLSNLGKMFPALCYRREAHWRHRLAVAIGMWPRGEVGAGVLVLGLSYGIGGPIVTVAMLSLALNLALTGAFILVVRRLIKGVPERPPVPAGAAAAAAASAAAAAPRGRPGAAPKVNDEPALVPRLQEE
jgi:Kef-type K+ transport system membrane component KefB